MVEWTCQGGKWSPYIALISNHYATLMSINLKAIIKEPLGKKLSGKGKPW
jgi:hypothetical protein